MVIAAFGLCGLAGESGLRLNTTDSIPLGLYRVVQRPVSRGALVAVCPPASAPIRVAQRRGYIGPGRCPGGFSQIFKRIAAVRGDRVVVSATAVAVDGVRQAASAPLVADPAGRALPRFRMDGRLAPGQVFLIGENPLSFDGRYFGPVPLSDVVAVIQPVWTWG